METPSQLVLLTGEQLKSLVKSAVQEALIEYQSSEPAPELLDRTCTARALGISTSMLDRLRKEGLPCILVGDSPRYRAADCVAWLQQRGGAQ